MRRKLRRPSGVERGFRLGTTSPSVAPAKPRRAARDDEAKPGRPFARELAELKEANETFFGGAAELVAEDGTFRFSRAETGRRMEELARGFEQTARILEARADNLEAVLMRPGSGNPEEESVASRMRRSNCGLFRWGLARCRALVAEVAQATAAACEGVV